MSLHALERRQIVPGDLETVFGFFQDPMNLEAITPPWMHFEVTDMVQYELPLGLLGRLIHTLVVRSQLEVIFDYRREAITRIFGPDQPAGARS